jgi:hypothetical protein
VDILKGFLVERAKHKIERVRRDGPEGSLLFSQTVLSTSLSATPLFPALHPNQ